MERARKCYGRTDRQTDGQAKAISIIPHPLCGGGLINENYTIAGLQDHGIIFSFENYTMVYF